MKKKKMFSIITCTLDCREYIDKNVESVINQNFEDYEQIIIDGYSQDGTYEYLTKVKSKLPKMTLCQAKANGVANAFNKGINKATGKYLFFLNGDDRFADNQVLTYVNTFLTNHPSCDWIYGKIKVTDNHGKLRGQFPERKILQSSNATLLKYFNFIPHQSVFMKREVFDKFGQFDESLKACMDYDFWLRIRNKTNWIFCNRVISSFTIRPGARSTSKQFRRSNLEEISKVLARYLSPFEIRLAGIITKLVDKYNKVYV